MSRRHTERGAAALMAVIGLLLLGGLGATAVSMVSSNEDGRAINHQGEQAFGLAQAGLEFAKNRIDQGANPAVNNFPLGMGTFSIATNPNAGLVTSTGFVGAAKRDYAITTQFAGNCGDIDTANAHSAAFKIEGAKLLKNCLSKVTITGMQLNWVPDNGEKTTRFQVQGDQLVDLYNNPAGYASGTMIDTTDYILTKAPGVPEPINKWEFDRNLPAGITYTVTIFFSDGSSASKSFVDPGPGGGPGGP